MKIPIPLALQLSDDAYTRATHSVDGVECFLSVIDGVQIIAFRGTQPILDGGWRDVLRDIRMFPWYDFRVGWSHSGFLKGARGVVDGPLREDLSLLMPVALVGHSLGGALAINAAAMLYANGYDVVDCVTFGAPRTLTKGSVDRFPVEIRQYVNPDDPVTHLPRRFWGYRHIDDSIALWPMEGVSFKSHSINEYRRILLS